MKSAVPLVLLLFLACSSPSTEPKHEGQIQTSATGRLIDDIKRDLEGDHNTFHPECKFSKVISARPQSKEGDWIKEIWVFEACGGKQFPYQVSIQRGQGSNFVMISRLDIQ